MRAIDDSTFALLTRQHRSLVPVLSTMKAQLIGSSSFRRRHVTIDENRVTYCLIFGSAEVLCIVNIVVSLVAAAETDE